jgi:hypothetical protein
VKGSKLVGKALDYLRNIDPNLSGRAFRAPHSVVRLSLGKSPPFIRPQARYVAQVGCRQLASRTSH